jgi:hypothetical protein
MVSMAGDLRLALDVDHFARCAGLEGELDPWQRRVLEAGEQKILLNCSRQSGKSTTAGLLACRAAVYEPQSLILCVSPSLRQSGELFRKVMGAYHALPTKPQVKAESALRLELSNGSRVVSLPGSERTTRGYSKANLVVLDEASRIEDELIAALAPTQRDNEWIVKVAHALHRNVELVARSIGEFAQHERAIHQTNVLNVLMQPDYLKLRHGLLEALRPYPKARVAVVQVLAQIEGEPPHLDGVHPPKLIEARADG